MPTAITHAFVALAAGKIAYARPMSWKFHGLAMACAALPDLDVGLFAYGVQYEDLWGHRGMMHSLLFAGGLAAIVMLLWFRNAVIFSRRWWGLLVFFFIVTASHGVLDAMTDGGLGIAFYSPFDRTRYFFPWRPIEVADMGVTSMISAHGLHVARSELLWVWLPISLVTLLVMLARGRHGRKPREAGNHS